jgi:hypothetical protein
MLRKWQLLVLICLALFLSGSVIIHSTYPGQQVVHLNEEAEVEVGVEDDFSNYEELVQQIGQLRRAQAQKLFDASKALRAEIEQEGQALQSKLGKEVLHLQLQLVLVSLEKEQQLEILQRINQLQGELQEWEEEAQLEFENRLAQLQLDHELELKRELALLTPPSRSLSLDRAY